MIQKNNQNTVADFSCEKVEIDLLYDNFEEVYVVIELVASSTPIVTRHTLRAEAACRFQARVNHWLKSVS